MTRIPLLDVDDSRIRGAQVLYSLFDNLRDRKGKIDNLFLKSLMGLFSDDLVYTFRGKEFRGHSNIRELCENNAPRVYHEIHKCQLVGAENKVYVLGRIVPRNGIDGNQLFETIIRYDSKNKMSVIEEKVIENNH